MTKQKITPVILSGGQGTRLWPLSRADMPKQFIPLTSDKSLFENTVERCSDNNIYNPALILASKEHRFLIKELLGDKAKQTKIIMEPCGRNTAAAIAIAALASNTPDEVLLMLPSDHFIPNTHGFNQDIIKGIELANDDKIVTYGIEPTSPHTGYGYIQAGKEIGQGFKIVKFHEKPNQDTAQKYVADGGYFWNAGIFLAKASCIIKELQTHAPDILEAVQKSWNAREDDLGDTLLGKESFKAVRSESIDYAIAEKTNATAVVLTSFEWDDLGQWNSLWNISDKDNNNNAAQGTIYTHDVSGSYLRSEDDIVLGAVGLSDIVAIAMKDAVFIAHKDRSEDIKHLVHKMRDTKQNQLLENPFTMRPWGSYEIMDEKPGYKVKKLIIHSGKKLSLQKHKHRSEHWVVVRGIATVTRDDDVFDVAPNESIYIPCGAIHRLENKQSEQLEIIEVQTGDYLGEDDIIRIEDDYNRTQ